KEPIIRPIQALGSRRRVCSRDQAVDDGQWFASTLYNDALRACALGEMLVSFRDLPGGRRQHFIGSGCEVVPMSAADSVSQWLAQLKGADAAAAQKLWERYSRRLVGLARLKLKGSPRRTADEEDVALSAFASFCQGAEQGRFPQLADRDNLWRLLVVLTAR